MLPYRCYFGVLLIVALVSVSARAEDAPPAEDDHQAEIEAAWKAADKTATAGPAEIKLLDEATMKLPQGESFIPSTEAAALMRAYGNRTDERLTGLVVSTKEGDSWMVVVKHVEEGYVRDGDAKEWEPDAMLDSLKEGTEEANKDRAERGYPELEIVGWVQPPKYDAVAHRLVWSLSARNRGGDPNEPNNINYNTYALGRDGYFSLNLLTSTADIEHDKPAVQGLLGDLTYLPGKRYEDFNDTTDKVAEYGLAALVGAVAIKKLGLLAVAGVFLLKIWKLAAIAIVAGGAAMRRFFRRKTPDRTA
jgi:uncharacterized membrane-anchored protein